MLALSDSAFSTITIVVEALVMIIDRLCFPIVNTVRVGVLCIGHGCATLCNHLGPTHQGRCCVV